MTKKKTLSRLMAVQIFYQSKFDENSNLEKIKNDLVENYLLLAEEKSSSYKEKIDEKLLDELLFGLEKNLKEIDLQIAEFLRESYKMEDLDDVLLQILRLAFFEIKFLQTAKNLVISEYVDITASFFEDAKVNFVNAVLDKVVV